MCEGNIGVDGVGPIGLFHQSVGLGRWPYPRRLLGKSS